jgi:hypothetical protein
MPTSQSPDDIATKWATRLGAATQQITQGVNAVTVNPAAKAAAASQQYLNGVNAAVASGKYQRGLGRVTLQSWQDAMLTKGLPRIATGATQAKPKFSAFMAKWMPYQQGLQQKLQQMPRGDLQTNIQRAVMAMEYNAAFKYQ